MHTQKIIDLAREIVAVLVHLKESPQGVPEHGAPGYAPITDRELEQAADPSPEK